MVESGADQVVGRSWDVRLDPQLTEDAGRYRKYDFSSVRDLLRVVRNKRHHFHELPERVQGLMSPLPSGFLRRGGDRLFLSLSFPGCGVAWSFVVLCLPVFRVFAFQVGWCSGLYALCTQRLVARWWSFWPPCYYSLCCRMMPDPKNGPLVLSP